MSVTEEMNITRALTELKRIGLKIEEVVATPNKYMFVTVGQGDSMRLNNSTVTVEKATEMLRGNFAAIDALFKRREAIKRAIILSNANTDIMFNGTTLKVAEAIELRASIVPKRNLLNDMMAEYNRVTNHVGSENAKLQTRIDAQVMEATKNIQGGADVKETLDGIRSSISESQLKTNAVSMLDPCDLAGRIKLLRDDITAVDSELDFLLNESNATTKIKIEY